jgi:hypothetical protein
LKHADVFDQLRQAMLFVLALVLGGLLGGFLSLGETTLVGGQDVTLWGILLIGMTYAAFGVVPAVLFGAPAIYMMRRRHLTRWPAAAILGAGGGGIGALLMTVTFTGFERWAALAGGSIGLMLGILLLPGRRAGVGNA